MAKENLEAVVCVSVLEFWSLKAVCHVMRQRIESYRCTEFKRGLGI